LVHEALIQIAKIIKKGCVANALGNKQANVEMLSAMVNFATKLRAALTRGVREALVDQSIIDPKKFMVSGKKAVKEIVKQKIILCGSVNKA
jgi:fructose/tagatose bisphosphate aldolase